MAKGPNVNLHNALSIRLIELRRHFLKCESCRHGIQAFDYGYMCNWAKMTIVTIAQRWDSNIAMRLTAKRGDDPFIFPCPDPNRHGSAYALTAEPVYISHHQASLF